ncbi:hypothetical protein [Streptomyces adustus]|uniref:hypothetical protein n=1 Tax=Streptomyces adustus TaxID=1609272 RepID=UPI00371B5110
MDQRSEEWLDQIVFRWEGNRDRNGTGITAVAYSCAGERAEELREELAPLLRVEGSERPSQVRQISRSGDVVVINRRSGPDAHGRTSTESHALVGGRNVLKPRFCLTLGELPVPAAGLAGGRGLRQAAPDAFSETVVREWRRFSARVDTVARPLAVVTAQLLRTPQHLMSVRIPDFSAAGANETPLLVWGLCGIFGDWLGQDYWTYATCDTSDTHGLRVVGVPAWRRSATEDARVERITLESAPRDEADAVARELVRLFVSDPDYADDLRELFRQVPLEAELPAPERLLALGRLLGTARGTRHRPTAPTTASGAAPTRASGTAPREPVHGPGADPAHGPRSEPAQGPGAETTHGSEADPLRGTRAEPLHTPVAETVQGPVADAVRGPVAEAVHRPGSGPGPGPGPRPGSGRDAETGYGPVAETVCGPEPRAGSGRGPETGHGSVAETVHGPGARPGSGPGSGPGTGHRPVAGTVHDPDPHPGSELGPETGHGPVTQPIHGPGPEAGPDLVPGPRSGPGPETVGGAAAKAGHGPVVEAYGPVGGPVGGPVDGPVGGSVGRGIGPAAVRSSDPTDPYAAGHHFTPPRTRRPDPEAPGGPGPAHGSDGHPGPDDASGPGADGGSHRDLLYGHQHEQRPRRRPHSAPMTGRTRSTADQEPRSATTPQQSRPVPSARPAPDVPRSAHTQSPPHTHPQSPQRPHHSVRVAGPQEAAPEQSPHGRPPWPTGYHWELPELPTRGMRLARRLGLARWRHEPRTSSSRGLDLLPDVELLERLARQDVPREDADRVLHALAAKAGRRTLREADRVCRRLLKQKLFLRHRRTAAAGESGEHEDHLTAETAVWLLHWAVLPYAGHPGVQDSLVLLFRRLCEQGGPVERRFLELLLDSPVYGMPKLPDQVWYELVRQLRKVPDGPPRQAVHGPNGSPEPPAPVVARRTTPGDGHRADSSDDRWLFCFLAVSCVAVVLLLLLIDRW